MRCMIYLNKFKDVYIKTVNRGTLLYLLKRELVKMEIPEMSVS